MKRERKKWRRLERNFNKEKMLVSGLLIEKVASRNSERHATI